MSLTPTILFELPQEEIASLVTDRIARSSTTSIVTGFATPGGLLSAAYTLISVCGALFELLTLDAIVWCSFCCPKSKHLRPTNYSVSR